MLLYFVKSKNGSECKNFSVFLCFYAFSIFPEMAGRGLQLLLPPP